MSNNYVVNLYESLNALQLKSRLPGTYSKNILLKSNSLLSTINIDSNFGSVTIRLLETFNGIENIFDQRVFTGTGIFQWKSNCFHNKAKIEIITDTATILSYFLMARSDSDGSDSTALTIDQAFRYKGNDSVTVGINQELLSYVVPAFKNLLIYSWHATAQNPGNMTLDIDGSKERVSPIRASKPVINEEFIPRLRALSGQTVKMSYLSRSIPTNIGVIYWDIGGSLVDA